MKKSLFLAAFAMLAGCASVTVCRTGETMVDVENTGWYLFCALPIATGDPEHPNENFCYYFEDTVTLENNAKMLDAIAAKERAVRVDDVVSYTTDEHVFLFMLKRKSLHTSAVLVK